MKLKLKSLSSIFAAALPLSSVSSLCAYEMHEWGTFTTISGSDGTLLAGLHVEEESLPHFVYSHVGMDPGLHLHNNNRYMNYLPNNPFKVGNDSKQISVYQDTKTKKYSIRNRAGRGMMMSKGMPMGAQLRNVTVKMETPVIYFYNGEGEKITVNVGFNGGTISQWYPARTGGDTPNKIDLKPEQLIEAHRNSIENFDEIDFVLDSTNDNPIDFSNNYQGSIQWDVELMKADDAFTFKHTQNPTWIYPKVSDANMVKVGDEYEDYLFYRGIGNFDIPLKFTISEDESIRVQNKGDEAIHFAVAFEKKGETVRFKNLGSISSNRTISESDWTETDKKWRQVIFKEVRNGLIAQGLTAEESNGMLKTWWKSYFEQDGLRIFWVVPQAEVEKTLPLTLSPKPEKSVRVIVGRSDLLRTSFEQDLVKTIGTRAFNKYRQDRFYQPYIKRLEALIKDPVYQTVSQTELHGQSLLITGIKDKSSEVTPVYFQNDKEVEAKHIGKLGKWKVISPEHIKIGKLDFKLNKKNGILTAQVNPKNFPDYKWNSLQIQLPKHLN